MPLGFYYGSYMDPDVLRRFGADPPPGRRAYVDGWRLVYTPHANMVRGPGRVEGIVYDLPDDELARLYGPDGYVTSYKPVELLVHVDGGKQTMLSFVEPRARPQEPDADYVADVRAIMVKVGLPADYIQAVA